MPRAKKTDTKQDALNSLVSGDGGEADDKAQHQAEPTAEDTTPTGDQAGAEPESETGADAEAEGATETEADPRDAALQNLAAGSGGGGGEAAAEPAPTAVPVKQTGRTVTIGSGKARAVVSADMYSGQNADGRTVSAWKGDMVVSSQEKIDHGVKIGFLQRT